ncbi:MAG TPA: sugar ABC transporter permease, partial [Geminicoccaceae bacterium]|nr:sugar ABC transporter permease [Geminicoccaceae bacterium]
IKEWFLPENQVAYAKTAGLCARQDIWPELMGAPDQYAEAGTSMIDDKSGVWSNHPKSVDIQYNLLAPHGQKMLQGAPVEDELAAYAEEVNAALKGCSRRCRTGRPRPAPQPLRHDRAHQGAPGMSRSEERWLIILFLLPTMAFMVLLLWVPFLQGIWMSFHQWPFMGEPRWKGLENYTDFMTADYFWTAIEATLIYSLSTLFQLVLALAAALALKQKFVGFKPLWRGIMIISYAMPPVVVGAIWLFLLDPSLGMITHYLLEFGIIDYPIYWFSENLWAKWMITLVASWTFWPFMFLIILSSLQSIPESHYELAEIYGANMWQRFVTVTWPNIKGAILVVVILRLAFNLAKIDQPFTLTGGGPGYETSVLSILMYRFAFMSGDFGMAFTVGMFLVAMTAILILPFAWLFQRQFRTT